MNTSRLILKSARQKAGMTQQKVADYLHTEARYYKQIEYGERLGSIVMQDMLEDLFNIHQRKLREISENYHYKEDNHVNLHY